MMMAFFFMIRMMTKGSREIYFNNPVFKHKSGNALDFRFIAYPKEPFNGIKTVRYRSLIKEINNEFFNQILKT